MDKYFQLEAFQPLNGLAVCEDVYKRQEQAMPGYGLYDRALGSQYLLGLWEALEKTINR